LPPLDTGAELVVGLMIGLVTGLTDAVALAVGTVVDATIVGSAIEGIGGEAELGGGVAATVLDGLGLSGKSCDLPSHTPATPKTAARTNAAPTNGATDFFFAT